MAFGTTASLVGRSAPIDGFVDTGGGRSATTMLHWTGSAIPRRVITFVEKHAPLRGDEVVTEAMLDPLLRRAETCRVLELVSLATTDFDAPGAIGALAIETIGVAICLEHRDGPEPTAPHGEGSVCVVETVARHDAAVHHELLAAVLATGHDHTHSLRWRPPSDEIGGGGDDLALPDDTVIERVVAEYRAALPLPGRTGECPSGVSVTDLANKELDAVMSELVRINNSAFAAHPEQGAWSIDNVRDLVRQSWFDPRLLLIAHDDSMGIVGFAVMKVSKDRPIELYLVATDANAAGAGLGRYLVSEGFRRARERSESSSAMLYVGADNDRAVGLYSSLGFTLHRRQRVVAVHRVGTPTHLHQGLRRV